MNEVSHPPNIIKIHDSLRLWMLSRISEYTQVKLEDLDSSSSFDRFGLDSLNAVTMSGDLEILLGLSLEPTLLWKYPTVDQLSEYLTSEVVKTKNYSLQEIDLLLARLSTPRTQEVESITQNSHGELPLTSELDREHSAITSSFLEQRLELLNERYYKALNEETYYYHMPVSEYDGAWVTVEEKRMLVMASYSYLGLVGHPKITQAAIAAAKDFGTGTHGVRVLAGTTTLHEELEKTISDFHGTEDTIVFSSGYVTNLATISTLVGKGNVVICDKLNHASIVDGCTLSNARMLIYRHNDMSDLESCLKQSGNAGKLVVVDAVFSMDGDIVNLPEVSRLSRKYGAMVMVDEAHSLGVIGAHGRGIVEHFNLDNRAIDIKMGTLSKTIPSVGGYITGKADLISALRHNARGYVFSASLPPPQAAAAIKAFEVIRAEPERVNRLRMVATRYREGLRALNFDTLISETPIVPIACKTENLTMKMTRKCLERGLFVLPVVFPAVPINSPRLRTTVTAAHTDEDIDFALEVISWAGKEIGLIT